MSTNRPFTTLNPREIKQKYPKTYKSITDWLLKCATEGNALTQEMIEAFIYGNPRFLYDYFDDMGIVIGVSRDAVEGYGRKKLEETQFDQAFQEQEEKL